MVATIRQLFGYARRIKVSDIALVGKLQQVVHRLRTMEAERRALAYKPPPPPPAATQFVCTRNLSVVAPRSRPVWVKWALGHKLETRPHQITLDRTNGIVRLPPGYAYSLRATVDLRALTLKPLSTALACWAREGAGEWRRIHREDAAVTPSAKPYTITLEIPKAADAQSVRVCLAKVDGRGVLEVGALTEMRIEPFLSSA